MEQPKNILSCWDFLTPVNYILILSFLLFPLPTSAPDTGSTEKFVSPPKKKWKRGREKESQGRDKGQFSWPCLTQIMLWKVHLEGSVWQPQGKIQSELGNYNFTARDGSDCISLSVFCILLCISLHETLLFVPSFNLNCRESVTFKWTENLSRFPAQTLCRGWWWSWNPAQFESVSVKLVLIPWKEELYYGDFVQTAMEQSCGWNDLQKTAPKFCLFACFLRLTQVASLLWKPLRFMFVFVLHFLKSALLVSWKYHKYEFTSIFLEVWLCLPEEILSALES